MEADISGPQRKVISSSVRPKRVVHGTEGIKLRGGQSLPFTVSRAWNAPSGNYEETWYLVDPKTREVVYEGPVRVAQIWGLQSLTEITDEIVEPMTFAPGTYQAVFALGGLQGGVLDVEVSELPAEEAA